MDKLTCTLCAFVLMTILSNGNSKMDPDKFLEEVLTIYPSGWRVDWPSSMHRLDYTYNGKYIPSNILASRFQLYKNVAFVVTPRFRNGVPSSLNLVRLSGSRTSALLRPWPSLLANSDEDPNAIVNAVDLVLDEDNTILWVLDIGQANTLGPLPCNCSSEEYCSHCVTHYEPVRVPPRIFGINIFNGKLTYKMELENYITNCTRLQYIQVERRSDEEKMIYVTDAGSKCIILLQIPVGEVFKIELPEGIGGDLSQDILYIALAADPELKSNTLFVTYLTSRRMYSLTTANLWTRDRVGQLKMIGMKNEPIVILGIDCYKRMFFRIRGESDIFMWSISDKFSDQNFKLVKKTKYWRGTHVSYGTRGLVWVIESNFQDFMRGNVGCTGPSARITPLINATQAEILDYNYDITNDEIDDVYG